MIDESPRPSETEADTRAWRIDPDLIAQGWDGPDRTEGARVHREEMLWPGRIMSGGATNAPKPADYVLRMKGHVLAVMEAKRATLPHTEGRGQAYDYATRIGARFAYCTNGLRYHEIDMHKDVEREVDAVPPPADLWDRCYPTGNAWRDRFGQVPFETDGGKWQPRYYQARAINAVLEAMSTGQNRILLTLATGTGKTSITFQIAWKLYQSRWNLSGVPGRAPRILFLADRNILADQAYNSFSAFENDALSRINPREISKKGKMPRNASVFFTIFQTFMTGDEGDLNFREYEPDFFDFIIIDECHRGGAKDESTWRGILEYFEPAVQLGLTATPKRKGNADTYGYFGEPVYTYALKSGIEDGFLTPFKVRQMASTIDTYVFDPDDEVTGGEIDPDHEYTEAEINAKIIIPEREQSRIHEFMDQINPRQKTLVFCATQNHAAAVRDYINQIKDIDDPHYCERVTANDGALGEQHLREFQDNERSVATILTTSQKLSTGVDARNVRNIVLMRPVKSMIEFKQIVGRGTRTFEGKDFFTLFDFVKAYEHFNDPEWDGEPLPPDEPASPKVKADPPTGRGTGVAPEPKKESEPKITVKLADGKERKIRYIATTTYFSHDGKMISGEEFMEQLFGDLGDLVSGEDELREIWSNPETRVQFLKVLADCGYDAGRLEDMKRLIDAPNSDVFDVLACVKFTLAPHLRSERANAARSTGLANLDGETRSFLEAVLSAYEIHGVDELALSKIGDFLRVRYGGTNGAKSALGAIPEIKQAFMEIQAHIYAP